MCLCGISSDFSLLSPSIRQVTHVLLTRPPLDNASSGRSFPIRISFDLHVLGTPPAFILSQDRTLIISTFHQEKCLCTGLQRKLYLAKLGSEVASKQRGGQMSTFHKEKHKSVITDSLSSVQVKTRLACFSLITVIRFFAVLNFSKTF